MTAIITVFLVSALFLGPLGWRIWLDRRQARAEAITADVRAVVNRRLRGDSFVTVVVTPRSRWRPGRIVLSAPSGYEWLLETVWRDVVSYAPAGYEVVFKARDARVIDRPRPVEERRLPRAA
jgi:hypothetical protein